VSDEIEFTGECVIPSKTPYTTMQQHIGRYVFASNFIKNKIVLDVACGTAYGTAYLLRKGARKVVGVDVSINAINYAKNHYKSEKLIFVCADATNLPFPNNSFDAVVSFETIEHIKEYEKFLLECKRVLKEDALFICSTPNKRVSSPYTKIPSNPFHVREFYAKEFLCLLSKYFANISLYGQNDINLVKSRIKLIISRILSIVPGGKNIKGYIKTYILKSKAIPANLVLHANLERDLDKKYRVSEFRGTLIKNSSYIVAICYKHTSD